MNLKKREINIDYLRIMACIMVIFLHVSAQNWYVTSVYSTEWKIFNFCDCLVRSCVPLFFMISGKLFLDRETINPLSVIFKKNILKLFIVYLAWSLFYAIDSLGIENVMYHFSFNDLILNIVNAKYHLWYLPVLISIYFILPVLWMITRFENGKYLKYACLMFFIFGILVPTLSEFDLLNFSINPFISHFTYALSGYSGYFLFGYLISRFHDKFKNIKTWQFIIMLLSTIVFAAKVNELFTISNGSPTSLLYNYNTILVFIEANIIFLLFLRIPPLQLLKNHQNMILKISKYTLFIYVFHVFVLEKLNLCLGVSSLLFNPLFSVPILTVVTFLICIGVALIFERIPFLSRWIM